jgi:hypothetical protein
MSRKILLVSLCLFALCVIVFFTIFVRISIHTGHTIARLRKESGPQEVTVGEIPLVRKKGWELFADLGDVRDIGFYKSHYYLATAGGVLIAEEGGKVVSTLNTTWGLPENSYRQLLVGEDGVYALSDGGVLLQLKRDNAFLYDLACIGKPFSIAGKEPTVYIGGDEGVFLLCDGKVTVVDDIERVRITRPFLNGYAAGTTYGTVYIATATRKDSIEGLDAVNDLWVHEDVLHIATPLGLVKIGEQGREDDLAGEFLTTIAEMNGILFFGTFDGRIIVENRTKRITSKDGHINRLKLLNDRLFACTSEGVYVLEGERWQVFYKPRVDVSLLYITTLLATGSELLIGTFEDGCFSMKGDKLYLLDLGEGVNEINQIVSGKRSIFFATNSGLFEMDEKGVRRHEGLPSLFVNAIATHGKNIIVGTSAGFCIMDLSDYSVKNYGAFHGLINNRVYTVAAIDEKIVLGTLGGISIFDGSTFRNITSANSLLKSNWVYGLQATEERIYIGTYGGGIGFFEEKGIRIIEETSGAEVNANGLFYQKPFLFAGTCNHGLFVYNEKSGRVHFLKGVFPLDNVTAVSADEQYYYIGTAQGMYRIGAKEFSFL